MDESSSVVMDDEAITEFLGVGGTGVISFDAGDGPPVSRPVSYGFDEETGWLYFRLAVGPDSEKAELLAAPTSFVTYEETDEGWRSVLATGKLVPVEADEQLTQVLEGLRRVHIPLYDVFDHDTRAVEFHFARLDPDSLTGRRETSPPE